MTGGSGTSVGGPPAEATPGSADDIAPGGCSSGASELTEATLPCGTGNAAIAAMPASGGWKIGVSSAVGGGSIGPTASCKSGTSSEGSAHAWTCIGGPTCPYLLGGQRTLQGLHAHKCTLICCPVMPVSLDCTFAKPEVPLGFFEVLVTWRLVH